MSYILDALKRADAERERGQVPGLHTQPLGDAGSDERGSAAPRWAVWAGMAVGAVVLAALAWRMGADANAPLPTPLPAPPPAAPAPEPLAQAEPAPAVSRAPVRTPPPPVVSSYAPPPATATRPVVKDNGAAATAAASTAPAALPAAAPAATAQPTARLPLLAELPASLRQQLPTLTVSGSVYSDDAASRFIMLNGDVVKQGAQPAPGLFVERIEPKSAVLRFKGERFRLPY